MAKLVAPWTPEQVEALNTWQRASVLHPFTCANRPHGLDPTLGTGPGVALLMAEGLWDKFNGVLVATVDGWTCPFCPYQQDWANDWMVDAFTKTERWPAPFLGQ